MSLDYARPSTTAEACRLLAGAAGRAAVLAGGTDLLAGLRTGELRPELLVDIKGIPELGEIRWNEDGGLVLGAAVPIQDVAESARIRRTFPALAEAAGSLGSLQVRHRATLGGNLVNASPCMDTAPALLVLGARLGLTKGSSSRELGSHELFLGVKQTALEPGELLAEIRLPAPPPGLRSAFEKIKRLEGHDLALVNAAGSLDASTGRLRAAIGSCGVTPLLLPELEVRDLEPEEAGRRLGEQALATICPIDDVRASAEYRRDMTALLCRRLAHRLLGVARSRP